MSCSKELIEWMDECYRDEAFTRVAMGPRHSFIHTFIHSFIHSFIQFFLFLKCNLIEKFDCLLYNYISVQ
jgi:hypothetical protein